MMPDTLQDRLKLLLDLAKNPAYPLTAGENIAAAKELIDTVHVLGHLTGVEYKAHHLQANAVSLMVRQAERARAYISGKSE